jgi:hypothetical protein
MKRALAGSWLVATLAALVIYVPTNDHFYRIAAGRQIARYSERPFRDFLDPGMLGTEWLSAVVQLVFGDHLLGEILLNVACIGAGATLVLVLAHRLSSSWLIAGAAAVGALALRPRAYDYDKFLLYPLGIWLCCRYYDRQRGRDLALLAACIVIAACVRYDNGLFIAAAAVAGMVSKDGIRRAVFWRNLGMLAALTAAIALPILLAVGLSGGIADAFDQVATYAAREGARTRMLRLPSLPFDQGVTADTVAGVIGYLFLVLPLAASVQLAIWPPTRPTPHMWTAIALCLLLDAFILRDPLSARIGGIAGPPAVIAAFLAAPLARFTRHLLIGAALVLGIACAFVVKQVDVTSVLARHSPGRAIGALEARASSPVPLDHLPAQLTGIVAYVRECSNPAHRLLLTWFAPEVYFFAQRGFAGGVGVLFGEHWSERRFQQRIVTTLGTESVPLVIRHDNRGEPPFNVVYPIVNTYLTEHYDLAGTTSFSDTESAPGSYQVLVKKGVKVERRWEKSNLPCLTPDY